MTEWQDGGMCEIDAYLSGFAETVVLHAPVKKIKVKMKEAFWSVPQKKKEKEIVTTFSADASLSCVACNNHHRHQ